MRRVAHFMACVFSLSLPRSCRPRARAFRIFERTSSDTFCVAVVLCFAATPKTSFAPTTSATFFTVGFLGLVALAALGSFLGSSSILGSSEARGRLLPAEHQLSVCCRSSKVDPYRELLSEAGAGQHRCKSCDDDDVVFPLGSTCNHVRVQFYFLHTGSCCTVLHASNTIGGQCVMLHPWCKADVNLRHHR